MYSMEGLHWYEKKERDALDQALRARNMSLNQRCTAKLEFSESSEKSAMDKMHTMILDFAIPQGYLFAYKSKLKIHQINFDQLDLEAKILLF